ncbi:lyase [Lentzea sp. NBRC 105346]|uniref:polysaccharide lyase 6 family protein n=1 Tax=Lentzea sp. NBRC 105346 TaxID=3032205 RepID=UPI002554E979|nr:polysaccharide lyase 6 family protein [Lentzea sp. NBRC 105346]GLZ34036.1 lyase [Lentzea sp. NBRC 105346]
MIAVALLLAGMVIAVPAGAPVTSLAALQTAIDNASPGDRIELADGVYTSTKAITIRKSGITVAAAHVGKAEIRGSAGFVFGSGVSDVVIEGFTLRHKGRLSVPVDARKIRITRNNLEIDVPVIPDDAGGWIEVNGDDVEVDHNTFQNRTNEGVYLHVGGPPRGIAKRTWAHHNYFFNHRFNGGNGGESVRIGNSDRQQNSANTLLEHNLFEKANGDAEAISVKSSDNVVRYNTIRDSRGFLVLRHGHRTLVDGNVLFQTGIRFHGNDHKIVNNYVENTRDRAMVFGSGKEADSGPTSKLHDRPDRVTVAFNTLLGAGPVVDSDGGPFKPKDCVLANNVIQGSGGLVSMHSGSIVKYEGNIIWGGTGGAMPSNGYRSADPRLARDANGLLHLSAGSPAIDAAVGAYPYVTTDFDPHSRTGKLDVGADEFGGSVSRKALTKADVGPYAP